MTEQVDIAVVGGGLVGKASAVVSAKAGFDILHIAPEAAIDRRTSALMMPSVAFMHAAGLVAQPDKLGVPLTQIRIIDATDRLLRAPETLFDSAELGLAAFGWNFANERLAQSFDACAKDMPNLRVKDASLSSAHRFDDRWQIELSDGSQVLCKLLVGADGKNSLVRKSADIASREKVHAQSALVCDLVVPRPLGGCSVEFHYPHGPFTLVPAGDDRANLVWIDSKAALDAAVRDPEALAGTLAEKSMHLFGTPEVKSPTFVFPLSSIRVHQAGKSGAVLVGEAAHAFPPIGAQGLNLGLRDVESLAACLNVANRGAWGWADAVTRSYASAREADIARTGAFVDSLFRSLVSDLLPAQALRTSGLWALKTVPALRRRAIQFGMG